MDAPTCLANRFATVQITVQYRLVRGIPLHLDRAYICLDSLNSLRGEFLEMKRQFNPALSKTCMSDLSVHVNENNGI